jgi:hypothetical protein
MISLSMAHRNNTKARGETKATKESTWNGKVGSQTALFL